MTRTMLTLSALLLAGSAAAHTGHGHEGMSTWQGLLHAASEPDHLLMLAAGAVVCTLAAPRALRTAARLRRRWLAHRALLRGEPSRRAVR